jgi:hypothetical protein
LRQREGLRLGLAVGLRLGRAGAPKDQSEGENRNLLRRTRPPPGAYRLAGHRFPSSPLKPLV